MGAEVVLVAAARRPPRWTAGRSAGARFLALALTDDAVAVLARCGELDMDVPDPVGARDVVRRSIGPLHLGTSHQPVEVDPSPAFDAAGIDIDDASIAELAAGSAGVLAGRIAAGNRRWRAALEP